MKKAVAVFLALGSILVGAWATADRSAQQDAIVAERDNPAAEVEAWYRTYAEDWFDADIDPEAVAKFYASPFYYLASTGPLLDTKDTQIESLQMYADDWTAQGWAGARLLEVKVKMLNESSAVVLTKWDIYNAEGESIIGCDRAPWTYLVSKSESGSWKLTLEVEIACGQGMALQ